jgi:hypothetical protein
MRFYRLAVVLVTLVAAGLSQVAPEQSVNVDQAVDRAIAQEKALVASLSHYNPLVETYIQELHNNPELGNVPVTDHYFLSRAYMTHGLAEVSMSDRRSGMGHKLKAVFSDPFSMGYNGVGFLQGIVVDPTSFDRRYYEFQYYRREFLGDVRCLVFDVMPRKNTGTGRFLGRIWVEDQNYNIVRFTGVRVHAPLFHYYFHFDSWRLNMGPGIWLPAYVYTEESDKRYGGIRHAQLKAQTRLWGYDLKNANREDEYSAILVDSKTVQDRSEAAQDKSPLEAVRAWEQQAQDNAIEKLSRVGLLAPPGDFEKVLDTVVNNVIVTNNLDIQPEVHCRVLLTAPLESFTVGHTIVVSRGLIDTLPDEASLAMVLSHELAHIALGHKLDTRYAFSDRVLFPDQDVFQHLNFARNPAEEAAADKKAIEFLQNSPYKDKLGEGGLYLRALSMRSKDLPHLVSPHMGSRMAMGEQILHMQQVTASAPKLDMNKPDQIAALPLGSRLKLDPWSDRVEMMKSKPEAGLAARDKMPFEVTPFMPYLTRKSVSAPVATSTAQASTPAPTAASDAGSR